MVRLLNHDNGALSRHLRRASVWFSAVDPRKGSIEVAGSAVAVDVRGTKVLFTAGHVLREWDRQFKDGQIWLHTAAEGTARLALRPDTVRLWSDGGDEGPDAGLVVLPPDQTETYFQLGQIDPAGAGTLEFLPPPIGTYGVVAGYPQALVEYTAIANADGSGGTHMNTIFALYAAPFLECSGPHYLLGAGGGRLNLDSGTKSDFSPGEMNRMSGCGFFTCIPPETGTGPLQLRLHGVHTATYKDTPRLRETPVVHHVRLIAKLGTAERDNVRDLFPSLDLDEPQGTFHPLTRA